MRGLDTKYSVAHRLCGAEDVNAAVKPDSVMWRGGQMSLKVYLVGRPEFDVKEFEAFLEECGTRWRRTLGATEAEEIVEAAGRICYMSFGDKQSPRRTSEYVTRLILMGHESVLEHVSWSFVIAGISRALSHQLVRHRAGFSFSQLSQQYHDESEARFLMPSKVRRNAKAAEAWEQAVAAAREAYRKVLEVLEDQDRGSYGETDRKEVQRANRSAARSVLPNATETIVFMAANARALRHFFAVRGEIVGDEEMRILTSELLRRVQQEAPSLFSDFVISTLADGSPIVYKVASRAK